MFLSNGARLAFSDFLVAYARNGCVLLCVCVCLTNMCVGGCVWVGGECLRMCWHCCNGVLVSMCAGCVVACVRAWRRCA